MSVGVGTIGADVLSGSASVCVCAGTATAGGAMSVGVGKEPKGGAFSSACGEFNGLLGGIGESHRRWSWWLAENSRVPGRNVRTGLGFRLQLGWSVLGLDRCETQDHLCHCSGEGRHDNHDNKERTPRPDFPIGDAAVMGNQRAVLQINHRAPFRNRIAHGFGFQFRCRGSLRSIQVVAIADSKSPVRW